MNIQEATKLAMENGKSIHRKSEFDVLRKPGENLELLPTNSYGYVVVKPRQKAFYPLWQPMAEDLIADDWEIIGLEK
ncbi:Thoeris anti-defense Tad2 family protein [Staphylococcus epidermidis]